MMNRWLGLAILAIMAAAAGGADEAASIVASSKQFGDVNHGVLDRIAGDAQSEVCGTARLGEITVATLRNTPIVTLLANGAPVTLLLDTGAETTILTPAAAKRIGADPPRIEFQTQLHALGGSLQTSEVELHSFTAGG